jgi:hypothetical protein
MTIEDDGLVTSHDGKAAILHDFYKVLLGTPTSSSPAPPNLHELLSTLSLNSQQAEQLVLPFTMDELKSILFSMRADCALP